MRSIPLQRHTHAFGATFGDDLLYLFLRNCFGERTPLRLVPPRTVGGEGPVGRVEFQGLPSLSLTPRAITPPMASAMTGRHLVANRSNGTAPSPSRRCRPACRHRGPNAESSSVMTSKLVVIRSAGRRLGAGAHLPVRMADDTVRGHLVSDRQAVPVDLDALVDHPGQPVRRLHDRRFVADLLGVSSVEHLQGQHHHLLELAPAGVGSCQSISGLTAADSAL